ncbi:MAG TPA: hypothetical protein PKA64_05520, partial [Myxococcota bacterium]|nr:hypothetical protein [Myxococcota bacterium]
MTCSTLPACAPAAAAVTDRRGVGLLIGEEPSGATWSVFRYPEDWARPALDPSDFESEDDYRDAVVAQGPAVTWVDAVYDAVRGVVELAPSDPEVDLGQDGLPRDRGLRPKVVTAPDGVR